MKNYKLLNQFALIICLLLVNALNLFAQENYKSEKEVKGIEVGTLIENFIAFDAKGNEFNLAQELKNGPVIILFYRGQWCPVCNKHLSMLQDSLPFITRKGAKIVAVSPEKPEKIEKTIKKTKADFTILYDEGYKISNIFDVTFLPSGNTRTAYNTLLGADLKNAHANDSQQLPVPATYIIGQDGKVVWRHFDTNYKKRASVAEIIANLP